MTKLRLSDEWLDPGVVVLHAPQFPEATRHDAAPFNFHYKVAISIQNYWNSTHKKAHKVLEAG